MRNKFINKFLVLGLLFCTFFTNISTYALDFEEITSNKITSTTVKADVSSSFSVQIPKSIELIDIGTKYSADYTITVIGDIAGNESLSVKPDSSVTLSSTGKADITAPVTQDKIYWTYKDLDVLGNGNISTTYVTAGNWSGYINFNINLESKSNITVNATNSEGTDLNATASNIIGEERDTLLESLEESGLLEEGTKVDALIEVNSDDFDGLADTTFNVESIAQPGDTVVILHYDETKQEWEYIGTEIVDENGTVSGDFSSYSPVAFVKITENGYENIEIEDNSNTLEAGLYDSNGVMLCSWEESGIDVSTNYTSSTYKTNTASPYYVLTNNYPTTTKVVISDKITSIGENAFYRCKNLTEIVIPNSVLEINSKAFSTCTNLKTVEIPNSINSINNSTFNNCTSLTNVTIPEGVTSIGNYTFMNCSSLINIEIPNSVTNIGDSAFSSCSNLTDVTIPSSIETISSGLFSGCTNLTTIQIPDSVTSIGDSAFSSCSNLTSIIIPDSVTYIGGWAFYGCNNLKTIKLSNNINSIEELTFSNCNNLISIEIPDNVTSISYQAFENCSNLTKVIIPNSVTDISNNAFTNCISLENIVISSGMSSITDNLFSGCTNLATIEIPITITYIGDGAFYDCNNLKTVYYTGSEEQWNNIYINSNNDILSTIIIDYYYNSEQLEPGLYDSYGNLICTWDELDIDVENNYTNSTFSNSYTSPSYLLRNIYTEAVQVIIPEGITTIGDFSFAGCSALKNIVIPSTVVSIGENAFGSCMQLTEITIPNSVTEIHNNAFEACINLTTINYTGTKEEWDSIIISENNDILNEVSINYKLVETLTAGLYDVDGNMLVSWEEAGIDAQTICYGYEYETTAPYYVLNNIYPEATKVVLPDSITTIASGTFENCNNLKEVVISASVTNIESGAFQNCYNLTTVNFAENSNLTTIGSYAFSCCENLTTINIPDKTESIGEYAFQNCGLNKLELPNSITSIKNGAFSGCWQLTEVKIPNSLSVMETYIFANCNNLNSVIIPDSITYIDNLVFCNCGYLTDIYYTGTDEQWNNISINSDNKEILEYATIHCNYVD